MADILSRIMRKSRTVEHSPQNDENDVSIAYLEVKRHDEEPDLIYYSTDSISSRALGCHLWPTFPGRPAFPREVMQALIFRRSFEPTAHCSEDR